LWLGAVVVVARLQVRKGMVVEALEVFVLALASRLPLERPMLLLLAVAAQ
jgi:hypothetical protein